MKRLCILMLLAGCSTAAPTLPPPSADTCSAARFANLIGQPATDLERVMLLGKVRVIRPGQAVTMDFLADRINFNVGEDARISSITCG